MVSKVFKKAGDGQTLIKSFEIVDNMGDSGKCLEAIAHTLLYSFFLFI
jgi:hypothetical protein